MGMYMCVCVLSWGLSRRGFNHPLNFCSQCVTWFPVICLLPLSVSLACSLPWPTLENADQITHVVRSFFLSREWHWNTAFEQYLTTSSRHYFSPSERFNFGANRHVMISQTWKKCIVGTLHTLFKLRTRKTLYSWTHVLWLWCLFYKSCLCMRQEFFWQSRNFSEFLNKTLLYLHHPSGFKQIYTSLRCWLMPCCRRTALFTGSTLKIHELERVPTFFLPACNREMCSSIPSLSCPSHRTLTVVKTECCDKYECACSCRNSTVSCPPGYLSQSLTNDCGCVSTTCIPDRVREVKCLFHMELAAPEQAAS